MPCLRHRSLADIPAACSFKTLMICSSVNLPLRIVCLLGGEQNPNSKSGAFQGSRSVGIDKMEQSSCPPIGDQPQQVSLNEAQLALGIRGDCLSRTAEFEEPFRGL